MGRRRVVLLALALPLSALDLVEKAREPAYGHPRSFGYALLAAALLWALVVFVPRVPSRALALVGGIAAAGALANLVSALTWRSGIPNPLVLGEVAFNLADVFAIGGATALVVGAATFALRHPDELRRPV